MNVSYDIVEVRFKNRFFKILSYVLDRLGVYVQFLFNASEISENRYEMVVCAGSGTYYAAKTFSQELDVKSVCMMLPKGYRYDFDLIFAQKHDNPPYRSNIISIPANFSYVEPQGIYKSQKNKAIGIVIGGDNKVFQFSLDGMHKQLDAIKTLYKDHEIAVTTSPRTSREIEKLVESYHFDYEVIFSKNPVNPIPDFLAQCETVFITADSTSMISEAISYGQSNVVVLPLKTEKTNKFILFVDFLAKEGYVAIFDGKTKMENKKIDFSQYIPRELL